VQLTDCSDKLEGKPLLLHMSHLLDHFFSQIKSDVLSHYQNAVIASQVSGVIGEYIWMTMMTKQLLDSTYFCGDIFKEQFSFLR